MEMVMLMLTEKVFAVMEVEMEMVMLMLIEEMVTVMEK